jgi:glutamyl/glutaminyl-tRNA synthetase
VSRWLYGWQVPGAAAALEEVLQWCGIIPDESPTVGGPCGPYIQSERLNIYNEHANGLVDNGGAYRCFCSSVCNDTSPSHATLLVVRAWVWVRLALTVDRFAPFPDQDRLELLRGVGLRTNRLTAYDGACRDLAKDVVQARVDCGEPHTVRLRVPRHGKMVVHDEVYGDVSFANDGIDDQVWMPMTMSRRPPISLNRCPHPPRDCGD